MFKSLTMLQDTEHHVKAQQFGLLAAGVLLGVTTGLGLSSNFNAVHADTNSNMSDNSPIVTKDAENSQPYAAQQNATANSDSDDDSNNTADDQGTKAADEHKITVEYQFPNGQKVNMDHLNDREGMETTDEYVTDSPWKNGEKVDIATLAHSSFTDFDVQSVKDAQGNTYENDLQMPDHDVHLVITIAPTGDRSPFDDALHKDLEAYQKANGLPAKVLHQAYGGLSQKEVDEAIKKEEDIARQIDQQENGHKNANKDDQTSNNSSDKGSNNTDNSSTGNSSTGNSSTDNSSTDNSNSASDKNTKKVTLTFNVFYNGTKFGTEQIKNAVPGTKYDAKNIDRLQTLLKKQGLTFTNAALKQLSGTVPTEDTTYDLQVVKAGSDQKSEGQGDQVNDAVKDSIGDNGTNTSDAADNQGGSDNGAADNSTDDGTATDDDQGNVPEGGNHFHDVLDYSGGGSDTDGTPQGDNGGNQPGSANNQTLPQTGNSQRAVIGLAALGLATVGMGAGLLKKKMA